MIGFSSNVFEVATEDGRNFTLLQSVSYTAVDGTVYTIPIGATSDGASTPPELWPFIPPFGGYWKAAFLHDAAYRNTLLKNGAPANLTKETCDGLLKEAMQSLGVDEIMVDKIYWGVAIGGWSSFEKDRAGS